MKSLLFLLAITPFLLDCAPEKTMNRKLDGTWDLITINGETISDSIKETLQFSPEGRNGKLNFHIEKGNNISDSTGDYTIMKYESITFSFKNNTELGYVETGYNFTKCTDSELILAQQNKPLNVYYFRKVK
jgi:hypothetical protein